jgi:hypothetical protein
MPFPKDGTGAKAGIGVGANVGDMLLISVRFFFFQ